jgi:hypothetical protein
MNGVPINYADLPSLSVPSQLLGEDLKSFGKGARSLLLELFLVLQDL